MSLGLDNILNGFLTAFSLQGLLFLMIGSLFGVLMGSLPGCTATLAMAVLIPITYYFTPEMSMLLLVAVYTSAIFGGSITAILINIPGTAASAATCFDGHPLAKQGKAGKAIATAIWSSFMGGVLGGLGLMFLSPALAQLALKFGAAETMMVALFGLVMVASISSENMAKGLLMGMIGMFLGSIGTDVTGHTRFTFGSVNLVSGFDPTPVLLGVFAIPEAIKMITGAGWNSVPWEKGQRMVLNLKELRSIIKTCGIASVIGMIVGVIPAMGPETATFLSYDINKKLSKSEERARYGTGHLPGVAASEAANNAVVGTSIAPMLAMGIPGSTAAMLLMSGLMVQGLTPGPALFLSQKPLLATVCSGFIVAQIFMLGVGLLAARLSPVILRIKPGILGPCVITICMMGAFAMRSNIFDVFVMLGFGIVAYFLGKAGFSCVPLVLGLILGPSFDSNLVRAMTIAGEGNFLAYLVSRPGTVVIFLLTVVAIILPLVLKARGSREV